MRLVSFYLSAAASAVVLSGCSWLGGPKGYSSPYAAQKNAHHQGYGAQHSHAAAAAKHCQIAAPQQPIPRGCRPEQVTIATGPAAGGFPQQPQFGQPQYANGAYGSAAGQYAGGAMAAQHRTGPELRKPRLRGSLGIGVEKSNAGSLIDYNAYTALSPIAGYNPQDFRESTTSGTRADGLITRQIYTANAQNQPLGDLDAGTGIYTPQNFDSASAPSISFDDAHSTPATISAGLEYVLNNRMTVFAKGGYTHSEGEDGNVAGVQASLYRETQGTEYAQDIDPVTGVPIPGSYTETVLTPTYSEIVNQEIATFDYAFSDMERYNLEVGARHYFNPLVKSEGFRTVTPFIGASAGASHYNAVTVDVSQRQAFYRESFEEGGVGPEQMFDVAAAPQRVDLYDSQWVPQGQLNVGAEWQVTPGMALALESGVRVEGAREYSDFVDPVSGDTVSGRKGDANISIPLTLRGSVNF